MKKAMRSNAKYAQKKPIEPSNAKTKRARKNTTKINPFNQAGIKVNEENARIKRLQRVWPKVDERNKGSHKV